MTDNHVVFLYLEGPQMTISVYLGRARPPPRHGVRFAVHERELERILARRPSAAEFRRIMEAGDEVDD